MSLWPILVGKLIVVHRSGVIGASSWGGNVVPSLVPPGSSHRGTCNIPQDVQNLRYSGLTETGPFYLQFRHTAEYYGWCEADCLFALNLALTGTALKFFTTFKTEEK